MILLEKGVAVSWLAKVGLFDWILFGFKNKFVKIVKFYNRIS